MKLHFALATCFLAIRCDASFNWGFFNRFITTLAPPGDDPERCGGGPRKWGFCSGGKIPTRTTTDTCEQRTQNCTRGTYTASLFIRSVLSADIENAPTRCRRFTHDFEYIEEDEGTNNIRRRSRMKRSGHDNSTNEIIVDLSGFGGGLGRSFVDYSAEGCQRRKRRQTTSNLSPVKRDIAILMDESGSVGVENFETTKRLTAAFVRILCGDQVVHSSNTRIALTSFDKEIHHHKNLLARERRLNNDAIHLAGFIEFNINYNKTTDGSTCLVRALDYVRGTVLNSNGARRGEENVVQEILILTDGCQNCNSNKVVEAARRLGNDNINVYIIGIALSSLCQDKIKILAEGGKCFHFFNVVNLDRDLDDFIKELEGSSHCLTQLYNNDRSCSSKTAGNQ